MKKLLCILGLALVSFGGVFAGDGQYELLIGRSAVDGEGANGAEVDTDADAFAARWMKPLGESGFFNGGINLERVELKDVNGGAWCVDLQGRVQKGTQAKFYLGGGLGGVFTDVEEVPVPVEVATEEGTETAEAMVGDQSNGLRATGLLGFQFYFSDALQTGVGAEYTYSKPLGDGFTIDDDRGWRVFLILPVPGE